MNETLSVGISRSRIDMAERLRKAIVTTRDLERYLNFPGGMSEARSRAADPTAMDRVVVPLLLRKARIHTSAVLRAKESGNLHSLAVQMRPVLECAGQIVFHAYSRTARPDLRTRRGRRFAENVADRINSDHFQTLSRVTRGQIASQELREIELQAEASAAASVGAPEPMRRKGKRLTQSDKVSSLMGGRESYGYLSDYFTHGRKADLKGRSRLGGVMTFNRTEDAVVFLCMMDYLARQVSVMNSAASFIPVEGAQNSQLIEQSETQLKEIHESSKVVEVAISDTRTGKQDGNT
ncbi:MAG: hypothetical protein OXT71_04425 [Acidobacteriota bacterium]|nr:hypothetical protein [Acidobacteriota bacterium]